MIFRVGVISRRSDLSEAAFTAHWRNVHGSLASKLPGLRSYRQNHLVERVFEDAGSGLQQIDGLSQLRFDSIASMEDAERSDEYAACKADIPKFQGSITILVVEPAPLIEAATAARTKLLFLSGLRDSSAGPNWTREWCNRATTILHRDKTAEKATQNFVVDKSHPVAAGVPQGSPKADAMTEIWFANPELLREWLASPAGQSLVFNDPVLRPLAVYAVDEVTVV